MGSTKVKTIDDSKEVTAKQKGFKDPLVEALNQSLGIEVIQDKTKPPEKASPEGKKGADQKQGSKFRSKKYLKALGLVDRNKAYPVIQAVDTAKSASYTKFPGSLEIHINTNVKNIRGLVNLPFMSGKKLVVLAFGDGAESSGADIVGSDKELAEIAQGKINFDVLVTDPSWMPKIAPLAKTLGPKGRMPNPKNGTITNNLSKTIGELKKGKVEYKTEHNGQVIHMAIGKTTQSTEEVAANIRNLYYAIGKSKVSKMVIAPTMGPGVKIGLNL